MKNTVTPLISVIVPVYNIEDYLAQCIASIRSQTYENLQIILVDDGSTDESGNICDAHCEQDSRIEVIHKKNEGLVSARKAGIAGAQGEYVTFVDGDDWIDSDMLQMLMDIGQEADMITYACYEEYGTYRVLKKNSIREGLYISGSDKRLLYESMLMNHNFFEFGILPHLCDKLIKRSILTANLINVSNLISYGEDVACTYPCLLDAQSVYVTNLPFYHYRQRQGSIVKSKTMIAADNFVEIYKLLKTKFHLAIGYHAMLLEQLHYYMWFILLVKAYERLGKHMTLFPFAKVQKHMRIVIYGAGGFGSTLKSYCASADAVEVAGWVDMHYDAYRKQGLDVVSVQQILNMDFDCIVIAVLNEETAWAIKADLIKRGIAEEKIDWVKKDILGIEKLPAWLD